MPELQSIIDSIVRRRQQTPAERALLVAISGIDSSGKGYCSELLNRALLELRFNTALIHADGWLNLPGVRFGKENLAQHFYDHAFRFDKMFESLVLPLRDRRSVSLTFDFTEETATAYRPKRVEFNNVDIVLLECIFLFKRQLLSHYDFSIWIDCSFETALRRAIARGQEGLGRDATILAYETIYFPAQRIHLAIDRPREAASCIFNNDDSSGRLN